MDLANASSLLPNLTSSVSSEDEVSEREENAAPLLPFQHGTTADESSSSESDSSEDRASVDARLSLDQGKPSPVPSAQKISEYKSEVARRPSSVSTNWRKPLDTTPADSDEIVMDRKTPISKPVSVAPPSGRSHDESKHTFSTQAMNHSRRGSSTSAHSVNKPKLTIDKDMSDGLISSYTSTEVDKFTLEERNERRTDSIESFELKEAAKLSLKEHPTEHDEEADPRVTWDANIEAAREALARARGDRETPEEFQRRCEALQHSEQRLREIRVDEDGELAQDLFEQELEDAANRAYAEALDREERENEMRLSANVKVAQRATEREEAEAADLEKRAAAKRREAEGHKQIIVDYLEREASRTREKSVDIEQKRVAHSRASSRVGSVRIDSPKIMERDTTIPQVDIVLTPVLPKWKNKTKTPVAAPAGNTRVTHNWYDRIVLQHIRQSDIDVTGVSGIPDMNVAWDNQGIAYETGPAPSRGSSAHPREQEEARYCACLIREAHANKASKVQSSKLSGPVEVDNAGQARAGNTHTANSELPGHSTVKNSIAKCANNHASVNPHASSTIKKEKDTPFYMRAGTNPPSPAKIGDSGGKSPVNGDPEESDSPGSSTSSDKSTSENNGTNESEETSSSEDNVDSSWEEDPTELCSEIVRHTQMGISSRKTRTGKAYGIQGGSYPPNDSPSDSLSSEEETKPRRSNSSSQPIADSGPVKKGPSKTARKNPDKSERSRKRRVHRNTRRNHHSHGSRSQKLGEYSLLEPGDPISAGVPLQQQRKWRRMLYEPYKCFYKDTLGKACPKATILDDKSLRLLAPEKYNGSKDIKVFETHIMTLCRWLRIMGLAGKHNHTQCLLIHSFYLTGPARDWYETVVAGLEREKRHWTHLEVILGLFDRFIDASCVQEATDQFWNTKFSPEMGISGFYNELYSCAERMVRLPDVYTFKNQLISRLPVGMVRSLVERNVSAEYSSIKMILEVGINYEWQQSLAKRYAASRSGDRGSRSGGALATPADVKSPTKPREGMHQMDDEGLTMAVMNRDGIKRKLYQLVRKPGSAGEKPAWKSRPGGRDEGGKGIGKKPVPAHIKCFNCSGNHYKDDCPDNERMNAIEEEAEEPPKDEEKDSESDYTLKSFSDYGQSDTEERVRGMTERFGHMGEYDDADVGDSGDESEAEPELKGASPGTRSKENTFNAAATTTTKPVIKIHSEPSVFGVCDDYSSDEFIGEKDLEKLAKKMATHVIWQGNTAEVEEFLFATGEVLSLSVPDKVKSQRIGLKCSRTERDRPPRTIQENFVLTAYIEVDGHKAFTLFDSGCTTEAVSPDFARVAGIKVFPIKSAITLQLGTAGSRSKVNHGAEVTVKYGPLLSEEYVDIINLDRFDAVIGTKFMRKHGISLDFKNDRIKVNTVATPMLSTQEEHGEIERQNATRHVAQNE
ncbi:hypothetical protein C8R44DRAFT_889055 [Mycena epipterygia]|nr:hypothetical protein C8R44DRAFT_889055 [Mycena epipterygia]